MDYYCRKLAEHLDVPTLVTNMYKRGATLFNKPLLSLQSLRGFATDLEFVRLLRKQRRILHFGNHHLARYGNLLSHPYLVTVHDLIRYLDMRTRDSLIHAPNLRDRLVLGLDYAGIKRATAVVAVSQATKNDIVQHLGVAADRIFVVHEGVDHSIFRPVQRQMLDEPYVLYVGSEQPRKNLRVLLYALARLNAHRGHRKLKLVKVGAAGGGEAPFRRQTMQLVRDTGLENHVVFTGPVSPDELAAYYSGAACLVLPSYREGFGFPPLEAMACGCPAIVSTAQALVEVAGGAALTFDPDDDQALADQISSVLGDPALRRDLIDRGLDRSREFSWARAARETRNVYRIVAGWALAR
jgi:glycosyltransferase involved in cell wall biosynthesis